VGGGKTMGADREMVGGVKRGSTVGILARACTLGRKLAGRLSYFLTLAGTLFRWAGPISMV
jgi:hypothetical protein